MKQIKSKPKNRAAREIEIGEILSRAQVTWFDDTVRNERRIINGNHTAPLTDREKERITKYFKAIGFPMKIVFR